MMRSVGAIVVCALITWMALAPAAAQARHPWTVPGTLRIGVHFSPNTLNPILETITVETFIEQMVFDTLVYPLPDGTIEPDLATVVPSLANGGISADGKTITYHLRHGVRWHDGAPFTSADVAYTQRATMDPVNNATVRQPNDRVVRLDTPDPYTVIVHLARPYAPFVTEWNAAGIIPAHLLQRLPNVNAIPFNSSPVGTGAFRLVRWDHGRELVLAANDDYFDGRPKLRRIIFSFLPNDTTAAIALRTHAIDWHFEPGISAMHLFDGDPDVRIERFDAETFDGVFMNVTRPALADVRVRRAIGLSIDRRALIEKLAHGYARVAVADIPAFSWAYDPSLHAEYDPAAAGALLDAAGWKRGADGIRVRAGQRLALDFLYWTGQPTLDAVAVQLQAQLRAAGIEIALHSYEVSLVYSHDGPYARGNFDLAYVEFYNYDDPESSLFFSCAARAPAGFNYARWCNPQYERLSEAAIATNVRATRRALYAKIERVLLADVPLTFIDYPVDIQAVNTDFTGYVDHDTYGRPFRWSI
jgi:peptide/nickel transport system substrate-binding protein